MKEHLYEYLPTLYTTLGLVAGLTIDNTFGRVSAALLILLATVIFNMRIAHRSAR